jgi:hypothetical protein
MKIGYSMWGFLSDGVVDTPDGSRSYRRPVADALIGAGHEVVFVQSNRDLTEAGVDLRDQYRWESGLPDLDALVLEWRWPLPGRNTTACGTPGHTCDLHRQRELLDLYTFQRALPTVAWDLDRRLPGTDPLRAQPNVMVAEYALHPTPGAVTLPCPVPDHLLDTADPTELAHLTRDVSLVYVGNQYDRDDAFERFFSPAARAVTHRVAGKWPRTAPWPHVTFTGRCGFGEVADIHRQALTTLLLLPDRYAEVGHQTSRLFEAVTAGCLPLTPTDTVCAEAFTPVELHVASAADVIDRIRWLRSIAGTAEHEALIGSCLLHLERFRLSRQVAVLLQTLHSLAAPAATPIRTDTTPERTPAC